ncbi:UTP--glucose-1-phosphate uridylyltransferase GalU [Patescibacteria group bacterium]
MKIKRAVIPVAGLGTRFLPATKVIPKEMLPIVDKPCIQYIVEEAVNSGIEEIIIINKKGKQSIEDHFDLAYELEAKLKERRQIKVAEELKRIEKMAKFIYVRQDRPLGDGHAILCAYELLRKEPFAVLFGDDIYDSKIPALKQLINVYEKYNSPTIALEKIPKKDSDKYGIIKPKFSTGKIHEIQNLVEKPKPKSAPSNLAITGKYIVTPDLLETLHKTPKTKNKELRLIDGMQNYVKKHAIYGVEIQGQRFDTGNKLGFLKATAHFALKDRAFSKEYKQFLRSLI